MAYMNQDKKAVIAANMKKALAGTGIKYSLRVRNHMAIELNITSAPIDFIQNHLDTLKANPDYRDRMNTNTKPTDIQVNTSWLHDHYSGKALEILEKAKEALQSAGWYNRSDAQVDYFDTAYYYDINIGRWNKPFEVK